MVAKIRGNLLTNQTSSYIVIWKVQAGKTVLRFENKDLTKIFTPIQPDKLRSLLEETGYNNEEIKFLHKGFSEGFDIGYRGPKCVKYTAPNLKFTIGDETELWNKVMKEVELKRYAGPFSTIPFKHFIQSPIGLVPKDGGKKTRLIFHLSYPRNSEKLSVNAATPEEMKKVKYKEFDQAIKLCIKLGVACAIAKLDMSAAFRHFAICLEHWKYLVMKARDPQDGKFYYFVDKCMPFGAAISCSHFQRFSDAIAHIVRVKTEHENINYLDDFFFAAISSFLCDMQVAKFVEICADICFPVSEEKIFWATHKLTFLDLLIDTINQLICIPVEKINKAKEMINYILNKQSRKIKLKHLQQLTGTLNFLSKAIVPGRAFTRRLYAHGEHLLKKDHHLKVTKEMQSDLELWLTFLEHPTIFARHFMDLEKQLTSEELDWYTDASSTLGAGGYNNTSYFIIEWDEDFLELFQPSINYLELYAVTVSVFNWVHRYKNKQITLFCDNMSVVHMINKTTSKCKNCMVLIRMLVLQAMIHNVRISAKHVRTEQNSLADHLSRLRYNEFRKLSRKLKKPFEGRATPIPEELWPMDKLMLL